MPFAAERVKLGIAVRSMGPQSTPDDAARVRARGRGGGARGRLGAGSRRDPARRRRGLRRPLPRSADGARLARREDHAHRPRHRRADPALSAAAADGQGDRHRAGALRRDACVSASASAGWSRSSARSASPRARRGRVTDETLDFLAALLRAATSSRRTARSSSSCRVRRARRSTSAAAASTRCAASIRYGDGWLPMTGDPAKLGAGARAPARAGRTRPGAPLPEVSPSPASTRASRSACRSASAALRAVGVARLVAGARYATRRRVRAPRGVPARRACCRRSARRAGELRFAQPEAFQRRARGPVAAHARARRRPAASTPSR